MSFERFPDVDYRPSAKDLEAARRAARPQRGWVDRGRAASAYPVVTLQGEVRNPSKVTVWASGRRTEPVTVYWNMICTSESGDVDWTEGTFDLGRRQAKSVRLAEGSDCIVTALATSARGFRAQIIAA